MSDFSETSFCSEKKEVSNEVGTTYKAKETLQNTDIHHTNKRTN